MIYDRDWTTGYVAGILATFIAILTAFWIFVMFGWIII